MNPQKNYLWKVFSISVLLLFCLISIYPVVRVFSVSTRSDNAFQSRSLSLFELAEDYTDTNDNGAWDKGEPYVDKNQNNMYDTGSSWRQYERLFTETPFWIWVRNSLFVSFVTTAFGVALASTSGYALSRFSFSGRRVALVSLITTQMFPATMLLLPFFVVLSKLGLINSFLGLFIIYASSALPFCIWQMKGYYDALPKDLEEAARLDGCSRWQSFYKIILPLSAPALVITALFSFMTAWSEYIVAAVILQDPELYTLPLGLKSFQASMATQWGLYSAGAIIVSVPVVLLFILLSKYLVSGLTRGSVKG